jgi:hypothetical protein
MFNKLLSIAINKNQSTENHFKMNFNDQSTQPLADTQRNHEKKKNALPFSTLISGHDNGRHQYFYRSRPSKPSTHSSHFLSIVP